MEAKHKEKSGDSRKHVTRYFTKIYTKEHSFLNKCYPIKQNRGTLRQLKEPLKSYHALELLAPNRFVLDVFKEVL